MPHKLVLAVAVAASAGGAAPTRRRWHRRADNRPRARLRPRAPILEPRPSRRIGIAPLLHRRRRCERRRVMGGRAEPV